MRNIILMSGLLLLLGAGCESKPILPITPTSTPRVVDETFIFDDLESNGGVRPWLDAKMLSQQHVRLPINAIHGFGCNVPTPYCISTISAGCYGPFVQLTGDTSAIDAQQTKCDADLTGASCPVLWDVEGVVVASSTPAKTPEERCDANGTMYTIQVERATGPIEDSADDFEIRSYR